MKFFVFVVNIQFISIFASQFEKVNKKFVNILITGSPHITKNNINIHTIQIYNQ